MSIALPLLALALGGLLGWLSARGANAASIQRATSERDLARNERSRAESSIADLRKRLESEQQTRIESATRHDEAQKALEERTALVEDLRKQLDVTYASHSQRAMQVAMEQLVILVKPHLDGQKGEISSTLDAKKVEIEALLAPLRQMLDQYRGELKESETKRVEGYAGLSEQLKMLESTTRASQLETSKLSTALKSPTVRGAWGENTLRNCVEMAGMNEFCDFDVQLTVFTDEGRRLRPDMIVNLPDARVIAVDAKAPLSAFLEAAEETDEKRRRELLDRHAANLRHHIEALSRREYQDYIQKELGRALSFTVMFIGAEHFLSSALTTDPTIFEFASERNVVLASPTILVPLLKALASGWKAERMEESAQRSIEIAQSVYEQFVRIFTTIEAVGESLGTTVKRYNTAVGAIDNLVPKAKKLQSHAGASKDLPQPLVVEEPVRESVKLAAQARLPLGAPDEPEAEEDELERARPQPVG